MEIVTIFDAKLFSFKYSDENEYDRLMSCWTDVFYLREYAKLNGVKDKNKFVKNRLRDAEQIQDLLYELSNSRQPLEYYFTPLNNNETGFKLLSLQKGKYANYDGLRIYAIKIDDDCFVITGGAIKMSFKMDDHPDTKEEKNKLNSAKDYLSKQDVIDKDSFFEFLNE
jgi:hypothetical protein